jgi:regulator of protease activity HflC (stomatin/prohibitin superfamily)
MPKNFSKKKEAKMLSKTQIKLIVAAVCGFLAMVAMVAMFDIVPIKGNEIGVKETWFGGVEKDPLPPKTYFVLPWERIQVYSTSVNVFVMNNKEDGEVNKGRKQDSYLVQSQDSQDMHLSLQVQWRIDPLHVVDIHKTVGPPRDEDDHRIEERVLRPILLLVTKNHATVMDAITAYSGEGLVKLQQDIEKDLNRADGELRQRGIFVDNFVIEHIKLDNAYVSEITARQVAIQREKRAVQEEKAALADAKKAKAVAGADYEKAVVEAERDKAVKVLAAEASNEQSILAAKAEAQKTILAAEAEAKRTVLAAQAEKDSGELKGQAILAVGKAQAESEKLKFSAFSASGAETYARIEVAKSMAQAFGNIKGYLPENMQVITLGDSFLKAVENVVAPVAKAKEVK